MDKELIMCIVMYVIIFLWIFICPVVVDSGEDKHKRSRILTRERAEEECMTIGEAYKEGYEQGRADAIDKVIKYLEVQFFMQNNPNSKFVETIVLHRDFIDALEQLKGNSNER